jgi:hypothetical protein
MVHLKDSFPNFLFAEKVALEIHFLTQRFEEYHLLGFIQRNHVVLRWTEYIFVICGNMLF